MRGGLPIRTCTPVQSEPSDKSSIVDAHRRISRRRSVNCYRGAGEVIHKNLLLGPGCQERRNAGKQRLLGGGSENDMDFTCTVDRPRPS